MKESMQSGGSERGRGLRLLLNNEAWMSGPQLPFTPENDELQKKENMDCVVGWRPFKAIVLSRFIKIKPHNALNNLFKNSI